MARTPRRGPMTTSKTDMYNAPKPREKQENLCRAQRALSFRHTSFFRNHNWSRVQRVIGKRWWAPKVRDRRGGRLEVNRPRIPSGKHQAVASTVYYGYGPYGAVG